MQVRTTTTSGISTRLQYSPHISQDTHKEDHHVHLHHVNDKDEDEGDDMIDGAILDLLIISSHMVMIHDFIDYFSFNLMFLWMHYNFCFTSFARRQQVVSRNIW
jgi:hypothetical protein